MTKNHPISHVKTSFNLGGKNRGTKTFKQEHGNINTRQSWNNGLEGDLGRQPWEADDHPRMNQQELLALATTSFNPHFIGNLKPCILVLKIGRIRSYFCAVKTQKEMN